MTNSPVAISATASVIDFTDTNTVTYGTQAQVLLSSGNMAMWAGDANGDGQINFSGDTNHALVMPIKS